MKTVAKITLAIGIFCLFAFAQTEKPKAAVYIKGNPEGRDALRMAVNTFLIKSQKYQMIAVDAIDVVAKEQNRQRGGSVSNEDIALLGRDAGAQYVCVVERSESDGISYVSTSMVSVQSKIAELSEMSELPRGERIIDLIEKQINTMLGIYTPPEPEPVTEYATEPTLTSPPTQPTLWEEDRQSFPWESPQDKSELQPYTTNAKKEPLIRLGARWRGGFFSPNGWMPVIGGPGYLTPGLTLNIRITDMINLASELNYSLLFYKHVYQTIEVPALLRLMLAENKGEGIYVATGFQWGFPVSYKATRVERDQGLVFGLGFRLFDHSIKSIWSMEIRLTYPLTKLDKYGNDAPIIMSILNLAYDFF